MWKMWWQISVLNLFKVYAVHTEVNLTAQSHVCSFFKPSLAIKMGLAAGILFFLSGAIGAL